MNPLQQSPTKLRICSPLHIYAHLRNIYIHQKISKTRTVNPGHAHSNAYSHWQPQPGRVGRENLQSYMCFWLYPLSGRESPPPYNNNKRCVCRSWVTDEGKITSYSHTPVPLSTIAKLCLNTPPPPPPPPPPQQAMFNNNKNVTASDQESSTPRVIPRCPARFTRDQSLF